MCQGRVMLFITIEIESQSICQVLIGTISNEQRQNKKIETHLKQWAITWLQVD